MPDQFTLLLEWRRNEAAARGLAKLPHDFYPTTSTYLAETRRAYESELRENPSGRTGEIARQTYQRASAIARDITEARAQKVLTAAFQASVGGSRELPNALGEERTLFDRLLDGLLAHRRSSTPYLEAGGPAPAAPPSAPPKADPTSSVRSAPPTPPRVPEMAWVRIVRDGRPIEVGSETVDLRADDVLSLPAETAKLLVDAKVAEPIRPGPDRPVT